MAVHARDFLREGSPRAAWSRTRMASEPAGREVLGSASSRHGYRLGAGRRGGTLRRPSRGGSCPRPLPPSYGDLPEWGPRFGVGRSSGCRIGAKGPSPCPLGAVAGISRPGSKRGAGPRGRRRVARHPSTDARMAIRGRRRRVDRPCSRARLHHAGTAHEFLDACIRLACRSW